MSDNFESFKKKVYANRTKNESFIPYAFRAFPLPPLGEFRKIYLSKINYKIKTNKGRVKSFAGLKLHYLQNMYTNLQVNRTKIEGDILPESGTDFLRWDFALRKRWGYSKKIPTDCYENQIRRERMTSAFMKKMNEDKYKVTRFARDNNFYITALYAV